MDQSTSVNILDVVSILCLQVHLDLALDVVFHPRDLSPAFSRFLSSYFNAPLRRMEIDSCPGGKDVTIF